MIRLNAIFYMVGAGVRQMFQRWGRGTIGITLDDLKVGESGIVNVLTARGIQRRRLLDLGFVPGVAVKNERKSPFGDPIAFKVLGTIIALRKEEAVLIYVTKN